MVDWLQNGEQLPTDGRYIVETDGLLIVKATEADDGTYTCRAIVIETGELSERNIRVEVSVTEFDSIPCAVIHCCLYLSVICYLKIKWAAGIACHLFRNEYNFS
jgi:Immunoglobulin I-set domain.